MLAQDQTADASPRTTVDCVATIRFQAPDEKTAKRMLWSIAGEPSELLRNGYCRAGYRESVDGLALAAEAAYQPQPQNVCRTGE